MKFSGNVDQGPGKRWFHIGDVPDYGGTLTFDLPNINFDHKAAAVLSKLI